jgi:hypothetical protein
MKQFFRWLAPSVLLMALVMGQPALATDPAPAKKEESKEAAPKSDSGAKKDDGKGAPPKDAKAAEGEKKADRPKRTFEGQEPLFYFDSKRRPYIEPFHKTDEEEYFICRGVIGEWYRELLAQEANMLAERDGLAKVSGSTCAVRLVATHHGKKLPIISVELYKNPDMMRSCILGDSCPESRSAIM